MKAAELFDVTGRVAFITGAASGLGLAMTEVLARNGARVVMADLDEASLDREAARLRHAGLAVEAQALDVADADRLRAAVDGAVRRHGRLDAVFANAGISSGPGFGNPEGEIEDVSLDLWDKALRVNLTGAFLTIQAAARHMKRQKAGSIVVTSSVAALRPSPLPGHAYHASKAALANLVRLIAIELGPHGVRVNAIAPGPFVTNIAGGRLRDPASQKLFVSTVPLGRAAQPDEIKGLALFLASDASSYVTGAVIPIDGGTSA
jgi:NAD(P)-dependent dehydrogenase (short-subunit alcohol dehydrogenase family)